jgi:hypothetical protein
LDLSSEAEAEAEADEDEEEDDDAATRFLIDCRGFCKLALLLSLAEPFESRIIPTGSRIDGV